MKLASITSIAVMLMWSGVALAGSASSVSPQDFKPNGQLEFSLNKCLETVRVDGQLSEPIWKNATRLDNFAEINPGDNIQPKVATEAYLTYDDDNLYIAFICYDDNPAAIRATITDRDNIFQDDFAGIMIDTFLDEQNGYEFFVNPYGIQGDLRRVRNNEDSSYDTVWESAGQLTEYGWTAEMAIPFRSIRFPDAQDQTWGLHVLRIRPRDSREQHSWAPVSRDDNCFFCQAGKMNGIEGVSQGKNIEVLPYVLGSQSGELEGSDDTSFNWKNDQGSGDAGVGVKYGITSNYTLDFTYNPDFSQIESDAGQINANRTFALFFPERRPFFLEGADIFDTKVDAVYTRSINDPKLAGKITGKSGKNTFAFMSAMDETSPYVVPFEERSGGAGSGKSYSNIVRLKRDVLTESFVGLLATDRRFDSSVNDGTNSTAGVDGRIRFQENYSVEGQIQGSYTQEPTDTALSEDFNDVKFGKDNEFTGAFDGEDFGGYALELRVRRDGRHYNFSGFYEDYSPTFRAENGFVTSNNYRMGGFWNGYTFQLDDHRLFERIEPQYEYGRKYNHTGQFKDTWSQPSIWIRFKKQTSFWTGYMWSEERFSGVLIPGIRFWQANINSNFSSFMSAGVYWNVGQHVVRDTDDPRLGDSRTLELWTTLRPTSQLNLDINYTQFRLDERDAAHTEIFNGFITRTKVTYQFTKSLFFRVIGEYNEFGPSYTLDPLLSYKINPFTVFFVGSSHGFEQFKDDRTTPNAEVSDPSYRQTERVFFVKFQYLLRV